MKTLTKEGFIPVIPQALIKKETMLGLGYMENGGEEDMYHLEKDDLYLVATAEHSVVPMHMGEVFNKKDLPKRYVGFSTCFQKRSRQLRKRYQRNFKSFINLIKSKWFLLFLTG
jgi:seryl-tRNA synthetase